MKPQLINVNLSGTRTIQIKKADKFSPETPFHFHQHCELVWIEKSFGKRIVGDNVGNFDDGDLVLMGPNLPHIWHDKLLQGKQKDISMKSTVIHFPPDFLFNLIDEQNIVKPVHELIKRASRGLRFYGTTKQKVSQILSSISEDEGFKKFIYFLQVIELLSQSKEYEYLASVSYKNLYDEKDTGRINEVYRFLMLNFHRNIELKEVAALCNMTPTAFCRFFKSRSQKSVTQFLNELRIGHACKLLQNESVSIADVCYKCGYNTLANFNKFFKAVMSTTPSEYRKTLTQPEQLKYTSNIG